MNENMDLEAERYRLGPFLIASQIPIPELEIHPSGVPNAFIRLGKVPESIEGIVANESRWWASRNEYLLRVPDVANFLVSHGREVTVQPAANASPADIRAYLLAPIFSTLCYQAGMYSLHASSVYIADGVVAFLGNSGAGKSTLAAYLERRGYPVVSDDICLIDSQAAARGSYPGSIMVVPIAPALKLWRSALEQLGASLAELPRVFSLNDKYRMKPRYPSEAGERLPLRAVFFLEWAEDPGAPAAIVPVEGVEAIGRLMEYTHYDYLMKATGRATGNFLLAGRILSQAKAFAFSRPRNFSRIDQAIDVLEKHLAAQH